MPNFGAAWDTLGLILTQAGRHDEALRLYEALSLAATNKQEQARLTLDGMVIESADHWRKRENQVRKTFRR